LSIERKKYPGFSRSAPTKKYAGVMYHIQINPAILVTKWNFLSKSKKEDTVENLLLELPNAGRILIGLYFTFFGFWNIYHWRPSVNTLIQKNFPLPLMVIPLGIFWQIAAGSMIMFSSYVKLAAISLIVFTLLACCIFHDFWNMKGEARKTSLKFFFTEITVCLGALIILLNNITPLTTLSNLSL
jgi:uncharacterized membrane protein YphA (DoxX/SURF4 family)